MYIFGKNNNHLIKNNYKTTFSLPQKIRLIHNQIIKCACGHDFIICLTKQLKPYCYFQSAVYNIDFKKQQQIIDIATTQNLILFVTQKGQLFSTQFLAQKLINDSLKPKLVKLNLNMVGLKQKRIKQIKIVKDLIFLKMENNLILHLRRNDWMQTKSFSQPQVFYASKNANILQIVSINNQIYSLTSQNTLIVSNRKQLFQFGVNIEMKQKLRKIAANSLQLLGISEDGSIVRIHIKNSKAKLQKISTMASRFIDLILGVQNYYGISQDLQAWVWGKNANGQLGLSDYQPRNTLYPMVSMQKFYITKIFTGQNYVCCLLDQNRVRQSVKTSERSSLIKSPIRQVKALLSQNNTLNQYRDSFNQTQQFLMPIRYTEDESKISSKTDQNDNNSQVNIIVNKRKNIHKQNVFKRSSKQPKQSKKVQNHSSHRSSSRSKIQSKVSSKKIPQYSYNKSKTKSIVSQSKTPKSANREKSLFKNQRQKISEYYVSTVSDAARSNVKSNKKQVASFVRTPTKQQNKEQKQKLRQKMQKELIQKYQQKLEQMEKRQQQKINDMKISNKLQKQRLQQKVYSLQIQLKNKISQNKDLFELISQKNRTIQDITSKIKLLQQAIQQHQKTLTARDNQAQQYFLKQKQYQLHIQKLQSQIQKMMDVLNYNERNRQAQTYKKQMERLSLQIKQRIQQQKQYYQQKIKSIQRKFNQQKNLYQIQIQSLTEQLNLYKNKEIQLIGKLKNQIIQTSIELSNKYVDNNSERCMESPTFHTLDIKANLKKKSQQIRQLNQSQMTLNDKVIQKQPHPLKQSNRQNKFFSPLQKNKNQVKTRKNSLVYNNNDLSLDQNSLKQKSQSQVKQILQKIQKNKHCISKSANKLFNLLQNNQV